MPLVLVCIKSGKPCPSCDANITCVWNQTCADSETCMVRAVLEPGFQFSVHCTLVSSLGYEYILFGACVCRRDWGVGLIDYSRTLIVNQKAIF